LGARERKAKHRRVKNFETVSESTLLGAVIYPSAFRLNRLPAAGALKNVELMPLSAAEVASPERKE